MGTRKRTEITIETDRVLIIRWRRSKRGWCVQCGTEVDMVGEQEAEALTGKLGASLRDCARARSWHLAEESSGLPLVCLESVLKSL